MRPSQLLFVLALAALLPACGPGPSHESGPSFDFDGASAAISELTARFTESHFTGDLDFLNHVFAEDARVYAPGSDRLSGRSAISAINAEYVGYGISAFSEVSTHRHGGPEAIVDEGTYTMTYGPENTSESGHYMNIWKQVDGEWKLAANMWTLKPEPSK